VIGAGRTETIDDGLYIHRTAHFDPGFARSRDLASGGEHWLMPKAPLKKPNYGAHFPRPRITLNSNRNFTLQERPLEIAQANGR
jgi:hypothetical protein